MLFDTVSRAFHQQYYKRRKLYYNHDCIIGELIYPLFLVVRYCFSSEIRGYYLNSQHGSRKLSALLQRRNFSRVLHLSV